MMEPRQFFIRISLKIKAKQGLDSNHAKKYYWQNLLLLPFTVKFY